MTVQSSLFTEIFALWGNPDTLACDMRVPKGRARQWVNRGYVPLWYWQDLIDVAEQRFGRIITYPELIAATKVVRGEPMILAQREANKTKRRKRSADDLAKATKLLVRLAETTDEEAA
jgi:hypothetical protein